MKNIKNQISIDELKQMAKGRFGNFIKAVVDVEKGIMVVDADLHADEEAALLADGSNQANLWGINIYPELSKSDWIEFDSMINLRPMHGNRSRSVDSAEIREKISNIVEKFVKA